MTGFIRQNAREDKVNSIEEFDPRAVGRLISQYGMVNLPWQLDGETIAHLNPPVRAYRNRHAYIVLSDPNATHVVIWSLLVEPESRGKKMDTDMLRNVIAKHSDKTWHMPAILSWRESEDLLKGTGLIEADEFESFVTGSSIG